MPHLQLSILSCIMKWRPSPVVLDDLCTNVKQPLQDAVVPPAGGKVQSSRSVPVLAAQADISVGHLFRDDEGGVDWNILRKRFGAVSHSELLY